MDYSIAKGVFDILPEDPDLESQWRNSYLWQYVEEKIRDLTKSFGYKEIRTPIFEKTELFLRSIGETSDIVSKEMYTFNDKGGRSLTLRPEGTAPVMRAFIEKQLHNQKSIHKFFYIGPMFRYERQQAGRFRQHHQFGVEAIGNQSPYQDVEVIHLLYSLYSALGLKGITLNLNSIGDENARLAYRSALQNYLHPYFSDLSIDSQARFEKNPLRILDSKDLNDQAILEQAPSILDFLDDESRIHFNKIQSLLVKLNISFVINTRLVRGLDYYNRTVFEFTANQLGSQNSIGSGGRYDGLLSNLGGPDLPAVGFGAGLERIIQTMLGQNVALSTNKRPSVYLIPLGETAEEICFDLLVQLRAHNIVAEMDFSGKKLKNAMRQANNTQATYVSVVGDDEINTKKLKLKELSSGSIQEIELDKIIPFFLQQRN